MRRLLPLAVAVVVAAAAAVIVLFTRGAAGTPPSTSTSPASWVLPKVQGAGTVSLREFRGRAVVVTFYASWCTACRDELPGFAALAKRLAARVAFVAVDSEENGDGAAAAQRFGIGGWPLARDVGGSQQSGLRDSLEPTPGMPVTALYDSSGHLRAVRLGAESGDELASQLQQLFGVSAS